MTALVVYRRTMSSDRFVNPTPVAKDHAPGFPMDVEDISLPSLRSSQVLPISQGLYKTPSGIPAFCSLEGTLLALTLLKSHPVLYGCYSPFFERHSFRYSLNLTRTHKRLRVLDAIETIKVYGTTYIRSVFKPSRLSFQITLWWSGFSGSQQLKKFFHYVFLRKGTYLFSIRVERLQNQCTHGDGHIHGIPFEVIDIY